MTFLFRAPSISHAGRRNGSITESFSVRTGKMGDGHGPSVSSELSKTGNSKEFLAAKHFLRTELQAARSAVSVLDRYIIKLNSFQDNAMELLEEAHRALSRVEQAVATAAAPELIVVACEIKVACHRGLHLFRTYGRYCYLGKLIALATRSSITAKFDAVIARLRGIAPLSRQVLAASAPDVVSAASAAAHSSPNPAISALQLQERLDSTSLSESACSTPRAADRAANNRGTAAQTVVTAAGVLADILKGSGGLINGNSNGMNSAHVSAVPAATAAAAATLVRAGLHDKVTAVSVVQPLASLSAAACVWWAVSDRLEFYSNVTQSTTSFAAAHAQAVGTITAITLDNAGNVWAGTSKGIIIMRQRKNWEQVLSERAFSSSVKCLAADADSDVVWGGDESGRLAVLRFNEANQQLECTAVILQGRQNGGLKGRSAPAMSAALIAKPRSLLRLRHTTSWKSNSTSRATAAEGPVRAMLVRDDRAWVAGGRAEPWLALFDAAHGTQLDVWMCGNYGSCAAMAPLLTTAALAENAAAAAAASFGNSAAGSAAAALGSSNMLGSVIASTVREDGIGECPRSSWRLVTGHENGQLLIWNAASDLLQPLVKIGEPGSSPIRAVAAFEQQGLLATAHANGDLAVFSRPVRDEDWMLSCTAPRPGSSSSHGILSQRLTDSAGHSRRPSGSSTAAAPQASTAAAAATVSAAAAAFNSSGSTQGLPGHSVLTTVKPRRVVLHSHRCSLAGAAACGYGVVTASSLGAIKLWTADALVIEAERMGLLLVKPQLTPTLSETNSLAWRSATPSRLASNAGSDRLIRHAQSATTEHLSRPGSTAAEYVHQQHQQSASQMPSVLWSPPEPHQHRIQQSNVPGRPPLMSSATVGQLQLHQWQQQVQQPLPPQHQRAQSYPSVLESGPGVLHAACLVEATPQQACTTSTSSACLGQQEKQQTPEGSMRSVPVEIRRSPLLSQPAEGSTGFVSGPNALLQQAHLAHLQPDGAEATAMSGSFAGCSSLGSSFDGGPGLLAGSYPGFTHEPVMAPRSPRTTREEGDLPIGMMSRDRRKSERRVSRGQQMRWSSCQMIDSCELKLISSVGAGAYGKVWLAEWMGTQVAVKELACLQAKDEAHRRKDQQQDQQQEDDAVVVNDDDAISSEDSIDEEVQRELKELMDEVFLLGSLTHPSISRFCALCLDPPMIVMQYYSHGSMFELLKRGKRGDRRALQELTWPKRLEMLRDVAVGMVFLHSRRPPIVHGDLRSPNLLLDYTVDRDKGRYHVKIADFGLARMLGQASVPVSKVTNPRWSAPEVIRNSVLSRSADVFSFGVVMWEMLTWQQPYEEMMSVQVLFNVVQQTRPEIPPESELPGAPGSQLHRYIALMESCWQEDPAARPTFDDVLNTLDEMRTVDCVKLARAPGHSRRVSCASETGTPVCGTPTYTGSPNGSAFLGPSLASSEPGSAADSASNIGITAAAAATAVAAAGAAYRSLFDLSAPSSSASGSRPATPYTATEVPVDTTASASESAAAQLPAGWAGAPGAARERAAVVGPPGTSFARRLPAQSDPGTPDAVGSSSSASAAGPLGDRRLQLAGVGSTPAASSFVGSVAGLSVSERPPQRQASPVSTPPSGSVGTLSNSGSPGPFSAYAEPSFAVQLVRSGSGVVGSSGPLLGVPPGPPVARTPSRLGPTRPSSVTASPAASPLLVTAAGPSGVVHVHGLPAINTGSASSSSSSAAAGQGSPPPKAGSPFSGAGPSPPVSPHHKGMSAYSPFAAASGPPTAAEVSPVDVDVAVITGTAGRAASHQRAVSPARRPYSPFSAVQELPDSGSWSSAASHQQELQLEQQPAQSAQPQQQARSPFRSASPFASVSLAAVEGPMVSKAVLEAKAARTAQYSASHQPGS